ncbi:MAG: restriction endonuclease subunit S [Sphingobium sp.]|jgi:type I restriction enzyme S subunit|nr:restriction endonuclease subunit S [Sphingobium sp.]
MAIWPLKTIGDLVTLQRGIDLPDHSRTSGSIPIMGSFGITGRHNVAACKGPGVTVGRSGASAGTVCYIAEDFWPLNTCLYVKDFKGNDPRFAYYFLKTIDLAGMNSGSAQPSLNRNFVHPVPVRFPDPPEQQAIAAILSALDDKIELNLRMNETQEASARALFRDWFVDFGPTRAKAEGRAPYLAPDIWSLFPGTFDDEGKPEGWVWSTIGKEVEAVGGSTPSTKDASLWDGDIAWTTPKDLSGLKSPVLMQTGRTISEAGLQTISSGLLPPGTVLMSSRAPVGYLAITQIPLAINQGYIAMRCNGRVSNWHAYLWAKENINAIVQNANGSTFQEISKANFRPLPFLVGDKDVRDRFNDLVQPMFEQIIANERESRTLAETRDALLPKLMSGEIRVAQAEKLAGDQL